MTNILDTIKDIRHSCEVIDGKRKLDEHRRPPDVQDILSRLGLFIDKKGGQA